MCSLPLLTLSEHCTFELADLRKRYSDNTTQVVRIPGAGALRTRIPNGLDESILTLASNSGSDADRPTVVRNTRKRVAGARPETALRLTIKRPTMTRTSPHEYRLRCLLLRVVAGLFLVLPLPVMAATNNQAAVSHAQSSASTGAARPSSIEDDEVAPDSPRASLEDYLRLCQKGKYGEAAKYLNLPPQMAKSGAKLARRLKAVLDRRLFLDLDAVSPLSGGSLNDRLPPNYEEIGRIQGPDGKTESVKLVQKGFPGSDAHWAFSQSVVVKIDDWYAALDERWFLEHLPPYLLRTSARNIMVWQWMTLPVLVFLSWGVGYVLSRISRKLLSLMAARTASTWVDAFVAQIGGPLTLSWMLLLVSVALPWLGLPVSSAQYGQSIIRGCFLFVLFWVLSRLVEAWGKLLIASKWAKQRAVSNSLVTLGVRVGKICILVVAVVTLVTATGYPAASLLAGLGVGGLAVALAAQKTLEHLFGAFSIGADEPFREGDFIKVDDISGTVESIGLRSTRIRTTERTVVSMPNGKLSEMRVECFSVRDRLFLSCTIGLVYETTEQQMRQVLNGFEHTLSSHPKIWPDNVSVRFKGFGASSLNIDVAAWFLTTDWDEFITIRQEVLLAFMNSVKQAGTSFALPTQTIHVEPYEAKLPMRARGAQ